MDVRAAVHKSRPLFTLLELRDRVGRAGNQTLVCLACQCFKACAPRAGPETTENTQEATQRPAEHHKPSETRGGSWHSLRANDVATAARRCDRVTVGFSSRPPGTVGAHHGTLDFIANANVCDCKPHVPRCCQHRRPSLLSGRVSISWTTRASHDRLCPSFALIIGFGGCDKREIKPCG